jgi:hypothetical protein
MKRRYSISFWLEAECSPQEIRSAIDQAVRRTSTKQGMIRLQDLSRKTFMIMAPVSERSSFIAPGSAIIGALKDQEIEIYYEGAVHQQNMTFEEKCLHAADRFVTRYPTIACAILPERALKQIGTYSFNDDGTDRQVEITDAVSFMKWIGLPVPAEG